jgi:hypothetical protein
VAEFFNARMCVVGLQPMIAAHQAISQ